MKVCKDCTMLYVCKVDSDEPACEDFDRGKAEWQGEVSQLARDRQEIKNMARAIHLISAKQAAFETFVNRILAAVIREAGGE